jgi:hypothetical protein
MFQMELQYLLVVHAILETMKLGNKLDKYKLENKLEHKTENYIKGEKQCTSTILLYDCG